MDVVLNGGQPAAASGSAPPAGDEEGEAIDGVGGAGRACRGRPAAAFSSAPQRGARTRPQTANGSQVLGQALGSLSSRGGDSGCRVRAERAGSQDRRITTRAIAGEGGGAAGEICKGSREPKMSQRPPPAAVICSGAMSAAFRRSRGAASVELAPR